MSLQFCSEPGCNGLAPSGEKFCTAHATDNIDRRRRLARPDLDRWYNRAAWDVVRGYKLRHAPMCEIEGCGAIATQVHHLDDTWKERGCWLDFIDQTNLQSLCAPHHARITMARNRERGFV